MNQTNDESLLAWDPDLVESGAETSGIDHVTSPRGLTGPLATHPRQFRNAGNIKPFSIWGQPLPYSMHSGAMEIRLPLVPVPEETDLFVMMFNCSREGKEGLVGIRIRKLHSAAEKYARVLQTITEGIEETSPSKLVQYRGVKLSSCLIQLARILVESLIFSSYLLNRILLARHPSRNLIYQHRTRVLVRAGM